MGDEDDDARAKMERVRRDRRRRRILAQSKSRLDRITRHEPLRKDTAEVKAGDRAEDTSTQSNQNAPPSESKDQPGIAEVKKTRFHSRGETRPNPTPPAPATPKPTRPSSTASPPPHAFHPLKLPPPLPSGHNFANRFDLRLLGGSLPASRTRGCISRLYGHGRDRRAHSEEIFSFVQFFGWGWLRGGQWGGREW
ncbi:hypothetical protein AAMO2058_000863400 [Amorphochlora amoebiformis]